MAYSVAAVGKCLAASVKDSETVEEVKRKYAEHTGASVEELFVTFCGQELENSQSLSKYGIRSGDLYLVSVGRKEVTTEGLTWPRPLVRKLDLTKQLICLVACMRQPSTNDEGHVDAITVFSTQKPRYPDVKFNTISLS